MSNQPKIPHIKFNRPLISVQDLIRYIEKGGKYISNYGTMDNNENIDYLGAIILNPTYQREYKSTPAEESSIIESILLNIPIPEIFLVKINKSKFQLRNVMDGKHRLNSIYRFVSGQFKLQNLKLLSDYSSYEVFEGKYFNDLSNEAKISILTYNISILEFEPLEDDKFEIELFTRYNKQTKVLESQEIRYATYYSNTSNFVSSFISSQSKTSKLSKAYNLTTNRVSYQRVHQNIFSMLSILENGLNPKYGKSTDVAESYMKAKSIEYNNNVESTNNTIELFNQFNNFIEVICSKCEYPFTPDIYGEPSKRNNLFQLGIAMTMASLYYYYDIDFKTDLDKMLSELSEILKSMHFNDENYNGSSTSSKTILSYLQKLPNCFECFKLKNNLY